MSRQWNIRNEYGLNRNIIVVNQKRESQREKNSTWSFECELTRNVSWGHVESHFTRVTRIVFSTDYSIRFSCFFLFFVFYNVLVLYLFFVFCVFATLECQPKEENVLDPFTPFTWNPKIKTQKLGSKLWLHDNRLYILILEIPCNSLDCWRHTPVIRLCPPVWSRSGWAQRTWVLKWTALKQTKQKIQRYWNRKQHIRSIGMRVHIRAKRVSVVRYLFGA